MTGAFVFVNSFAIKEGKVDELRASLAEFFSAVESNEPRLLGINAYVNEAGTEVTFVQVHPDAASLEDHQRVAHEHSRRSGRFLGAAKSIQVYGEPSEVVLKRLGQHAAAGVAVTVKPKHVGGFTRGPEQPAGRFGHPPDRAAHDRRHEVENS